MAELKIGRITLGMCQTNFYFLYPQGQTEVIAVDPADNGDYLYETLKKNGFTVGAILLTHGHFDHIWGCEKLRELSGAKVYAYEGEKAVLESERLNVSAGAGRLCTIKADVYLKDLQEMTLCNVTFQLIATPGHTEGSCCYYFKEADFLLSGDTLFQESVGRTDLPTGSGGILSSSIKERLLPLPEETKVYPGHGDITSIGHEKKYNPFC